MGTASLGRGATPCQHDQWPKWPKRLAVGGWRRLVVGDWWLVAVGGGWQWLAVGGWWSLGAVLSKKINLGSFRTALLSSRPLLKDPERAGGEAIFGTQTFGSQTSPPSSSFLTHPWPGWGRGGVQQVWVGTYLSIPPPSPHPVETGASGFVTVVQKTGTGTLFLLSPRRPPQRYTSTCKMPRPPVLACRWAVEGCVCVCVCVICTFRGGSLCSVGLDASFGSGLLRPLCDVVSLTSAESEPL